MDKNIAKIDETTSSLYAAKYQDDTFTISYLEPMTLNEGDKLFVEVNAPNEKWFRMKLKSVDNTVAATEIFHYYTEQDSVKEFFTVTYEAPVGGITFQTLEFAHEQSISLDFYVKSVRIEKANQLSKYAYFNVNFASEETLPSGFVSNNGSKQYGFDEKEDALWACATHKSDMTNSFFLKYPDIKLSAGDSITITMKAHTTANDGGGIYLNGSKFIKNFSKTENYETLTYEFKEETVLSKLYFWGYTSGKAYDLFIKSVEIDVKNASISDTTIDFNSDANAANYYMKAVTAKNGTELVKDTVNGEEVTVLKVKEVWKGDKLSIRFDNIVLAANTTVTITVKAMANGETTEKNGSFDMNGAWKANISVAGDWNTVSFTVNEETTLSSLELFSYTTQVSHDFYIASIVIS
jgi:hypothetical protein